MKKILSVVLVLSLVLLLSSCGNKLTDASSSSPAVSSEENIIEVSPKEDKTGDIENYNPDSKETHNFSDTGEKFERTVNQNLEVGAFLNDTGAINIAIENNILGKTVETKDFDAKYFCLTAQIQLATDLDAEVSKEEFDKVIFDNYGVIAGNSTYSVAGVATYSGGMYNIRQYPFKAAYGALIDECELLGNGYVKYFGEYSYSASGDLDNEDYYELTCLVKHTSESSKGMNLLAFEIKKAEKSKFIEE